MNHEELTELFKEQIATSNPLTEEMIAKAKESRKPLEDGRVLSLGVWEHAKPGDKIIRYILSTEVNTNGDIVLDVVPILLSEMDKLDELVFDHKQGYFPVFREPSDET